MKLSVGYPEGDAEVEMLDRFERESPLSGISAVATKQEVIEAREAVRSVILSGDVRRYIVSISEASRSHPNVRLGVSPRGSLALMRASQVRAAFEGRDYVTPDDVKAMAPAVIGHRILCKGGIPLRDSGTAAGLVEEILASVPVPLE